MLCHKIIIFLQAERCRREVRREKFTHKELYPTDDPPRPSRPKGFCHGGNMPEGHEDDGDESYDDRR